MTRATHHRISRGTTTDVHLGTATIILVGVFLTRLAGLGNGQQDVYSMEPVSTLQSDEFTQTLEQQPAIVWAMAKLISPMLEQTRRVRRQQQQAGAAADDLSNDDEAEKRKPLPPVIDPGQCAAYCLHAPQTTWSWVSECRPCTSDILEAYRSMAQASNRKRASALALARDTCEGFCESLSEWQASQVPDQCGGCPEIARLLATPRMHVPPEPITKLDSHTHAPTEGPEAHTQ